MGFLGTPRRSALLGDGRWVILFWEMGTPGRWVIFFWEMGTPGRWVLLFWEMGAPGRWVILFWEMGTPGRWVLLGDGYSWEIGTPGRWVLLWIVGEILRDPERALFPKYGGYYPLPRSADKYPKFISSSTIGIRNGHPLIPTSNTPEYL